MKTRKYPQLLNYLLNPNRIFWFLKYSIVPYQCLLTLMSRLLSFKSHDAFLCWCLLTSCAPLLRLFVSTSSNHYLSLTVIPLSFFLHMPSSGDCSSIIFLCPPMQFFSNIHTLLTLTTSHVPLYIVPGSFNVQYGPIWSHFPSWSHISNSRYLQAFTLSLKEVARNICPGYCTCYFNYNAYIASLTCTIL